MAEQTLSDARKEQIKLRATFLNNIGIGVVLIGVFTPINRAMYEPAAVSGNSVSIGGTMVICFFCRMGPTFCSECSPKGLSK